MPGQAKRGEYLSWLAYRPGVMEPALLCKRLEVKHVFGMMGWAPAEEVEAKLNEHLSTRKYMLGDDFSAADILIGGGIHFMIMAKMLGESSTFMDYTARITARPAFAKAMKT